MKVYLANQPVDFRKGPDSQLSLVRDAGSDPFSFELEILAAHVLGEILKVRASSPMRPAFRPSRPEPAP